MPKAIFKDQRAFARKTPANSDNPHKDRKIRLFANPENA